MGYRNFYMFCRYHYLYYFGSLTMRRIIIATLVGFLFIWCVAQQIQIYELRRKPLPNEQPKSVARMVKELQERVGAVPDGIIGSETKERVNKAVEREMFNGYAAEYMTPSGAIKDANLIVTLQPAKGDGRK
jgi:hypothetical protein